MNMWPGTVGLAVGFLIIASIVLWVFINTRGSVVIKAFLVAITIWYGLVVFFSIRNFMGWPAAAAVPPNSRVLAVRIEEPYPARDRAGGIYLWVVTDSAKEEPMETAIPLRLPSLFDYPETSHPRAYKLPYSKSMHRAIIEAQKKMKGTPGGQMRTKVGKKGKSGMGGGHEGDRSTLEFEIVNPVRILPKDHAYQE